MNECFIFLYKVENKVVFFFFFGAFDEVVKFVFFVFVFVALLLVKTSKSTIVFKKTEVVKSCTQTNNINSI